jgi:hypothetical protein
MTGADELDFLLLPRDLQHLGALIATYAEGDPELKARQPRQAGKEKKDVLIGMRSGLRRALSASILNLTR